MESKTLAISAVFLSVCLLTVLVMWAFFIDLDEKINSTKAVCSDELLTVDDYQLLSPEAKIEARATGNSWFYKDGKVHVIENVPKQYMEE